MKKIYLLLMLLLPAACMWATDVTVTPDTTQTVKAGNTYKLTATSEETPTEFTLTSNNKQVAANLVINAPSGKEVIVKLKGFQILHSKPVVVNHSGTVTFIVESTSRIDRDASTKTDGIAGIAIDAQFAHVNFQIKPGATLYVTLDTPGTSSRQNINVLPIYAKNVSIEGKMRCYALAKGDKHYGDDYPLTPCIVAKETLTITGENTDILFSFYAGAPIKVATVANQLAPVKYTTLNCTGGAIKEDGTTFPSSGELVTTTRYNYPTLSYDKLINEAMGGTIIGTVIEPKPATFTFPKWVISGSAADYLACFKSATTGANPTADAISIDAEKKTVYIDTTKCPDPELVYAKDGTAGAIDLFGATARPTADGIAVTYAFGIERIEVVEGEIQLRAAVDLPTESADTKTFRISVTIEGNAEIFDADLQFTRIKGTTRFLSDLIRTGHLPGTPGSTSHEYRVSASEAVTE